MPVSVSKKLPVLAVIALAAATIVGEGRAHAAPVTATLDYQATFGALGTDTITGSVTFDATAQLLVSNITVSGPLLPGTYTENTSVVSEDSGSAIGFISALPIEIALSGLFSPSTFSSSIVFSEFDFSLFDLDTLQNTNFSSTSVTELADTAVPEPSTMAVFASGTIGLWFRRRHRRQAL